MVLGGSWRLFSGIDDLIVYYQQGANPASALNLVPNVPLDLYVKLDWQADDADTGRPMEAVTRTDIQSAYLRAWLQWNLSLLKNEPYGIVTYFVGPALVDISSSIREVAAKKWLVEQADMTHSLKLHFYSADGSIVSFTDSKVTLVTIIHDKSGNVIFTGETTAVYQVVMLLSDGNWRVRHWVQTSNQPLDTMKTLLPAHPAFIGKDTKHSILTLDGRPYYIAGINYYPVDAGWDRFWVWYTPKTINYDFNIIRSLGLNTIRIFIPFDQFGGAALGNNPGLQPTPQPTPASGKVAAPTNGTIVAQPLRKLEDLLTRASTYNLHVIVTLFDFRSDYTLLHWPNADSQLEALLTHFKNNPTILAWDLKNEPDQDYHAAGKYLVDAWLTHVAYTARLSDPNHLLTIGWASPQAAQTTIPGIDFVSFHYYAPAAYLASAYAALRAAHPGEPIVLGEFGLPTWNSFFFPNGHTEAEQTAYYAAILRFLRTSDSAGYLAWTLYDFSYVPPTAAGGSPWQIGPQKAMGILHTNARPKRASQLLAPGANLNVPAVPAWRQMIKPFWITVATSMLLLAGFSLLNVRRRKLRRHNGQASVSMHLQQDNEDNEQEGDNDHGGL
jgi:hypothetical protein